ncbi:hypothetical protein M409DRAFT_52461 [Zasmidium cellare ATCC 36951]|uniref:Heterokaryon incompatibility domain-containing protein n=1 Tax=Zasmidium cellare ATCC 36951 TaxID=1080233 RepID=A0A6A6CQ34_ZASCE|nr:uncharacterized protein M409DRAFT_52461 [Zasmidium cellare ATCC 36951]KAF2169181.1 hypothetical protein M409DRAFT_52461 [Zasmidium cellare ATCC 36951]
MICRLCAAFTVDVIHGEYATWKRLSETEYSFKHGTHETVVASAAAGCATCGLFRLVRQKKIPGYESLGDKWLMKSAMVIVATSGPRFSFDLMSEGPNSSWIGFELFQPRSDQRADPGLEPIAQLRCEVSDDPLSATTIRMASLWVDQCHYNQRDCSRQDKTPLPTRIIDVGYSDECISARLQVNRGQLGRYVTLSHCWGSAKRLVTNKRNLKKFQNEIPLNQMPETFQDAIKLTRLLGMRYLWIDALCIVQDDREDWRRESANMCSIYENAAFSISALVATDSSSGFLHARDIDQCVVAAGDLTFGVRPKLQSIDEALRESKLESRAWCLQERILAPAVLHIGHQQLFWECRACSVSETEPDSGEEGPSSRSPNSSFTYIPSAPDRKELLRLWYGLVKEYSARDLTKPTDRLPAIAGLADKVRREFGGSPLYVDGLWLDDLMAGLLWRRPNRPKPRLSTTNGEAQTLSTLTPSWSWASTLGAVEYSWQAEFEFHLPSPHDMTASLDTASPTTVLQVEGYVKRGMCRLSSPSSSSNSTSNAAFKPSGSSIVIDSIACMLDDVEEVVPSHCYCLWVSTWTSFKSQTTKKAKSANRAFYLVLERVHDSLGDSASKANNSLGRFKRIGMGYDAADKVTRAFVNAERHNLELT